MDVVIERSPKALKVTKVNNYLQTKNGIIQDIKYLIFFEMLLGVNRLYLLGYQKLVLYFSYIYNLVFLVFTVTFLYLSDLNTIAQIFYKNIVGVEYLLLILSALLTQKKQLNKLFSELQLFDEKLNISDEISETTPRRWWIYGIVSVFLHFMFEVFLAQILIFGSNGLKISYSMYASRLPGTVHDIEILFFCFMIGIIRKRLTVLKAHVSKEFYVDGEILDNKCDKIEDLSKKADLDINSLLKSYDLLHKCAEHLNSVMSFPVVVILITSALSTIMLLKNTIRTVEINSSISTIVLKSTVILVLGRVLKYILLLTLLCHLSNKTHAQMAMIRTIIHDTLTSNKLNKTERRKLKAFFQLSHENEFTYALWGIVRLDMALPLSYLNLCTTYLIIVVQFSRFID